MSNLLNKLKLDKIKALTRNNPIDEERKKQIEELINQNMESYKENYNEQFIKISKEKTKENIRLVFDEIDKEAKEEAGMAVAKENIAEIVKIIVLLDIVSQLPDQSKEVGKMAAEKSIDKIVDKTVNKIVDKFTDEQKDNMSKTSVNDNKSKIQNEETELTEVKYLEKQKSINFQSTVGPSQNEKQLLLEENLSIGEIKERLATEFGLPSGEFHLSFKGRTIDQDAILSNFHVKDDDTMLLIPVSTAGALFI